MGAWKLTAGLILLVVILNNNIQALEAVPKGNSSHGMQRMIFPDFRQLSEEDAFEFLEFLQLLSEFAQCASKWFATIGDPCSDKPICMSDLKRLEKAYPSGDVPASEVMKLVRNMCIVDPPLKCSAGKCKCPGSSADSSSCNGRLIPEQDFNQNCDKETKALMSSASRLARKLDAQGSSKTKSDVPDPCSGSRTSDPGQYFQYIILMAVILCFVAVN